MSHCRMPLLALEVYLTHKRGQIKVVEKLGLHGVGAQAEETTSGDRRHRKMVMKKDVKGT